MSKLPLLMKITCYMLHVPSSDFPWSPAPFSFLLSSLGCEACARRDFPGIFLGDDQRQCQVRQDGRHVPMNERKSWTAPELTCRHAKGGPNSVAMMGLRQSRDREEPKSPSLGEGQARMDAWVCVVGASEKWPARSEVDENRHSGGGPSGASPRLLSNLLGSRVNTRRTAQQLFRPPFSMHTQRLPRLLWTGWDLRELHEPRTAGKTTTDGIDGN